ncbi:MAG: energy transducer TonB [Terriglobales bacterium]|jgi:TonB family protein
MSLKGNHACFIIGMMLFHAVAAHSQAQPPDNANAAKVAPQHSVSVGGGVTPPHVTYQPSPEYSENARAAGLEGTCILWMVIGPDGKPRDIKVVRTLGLGLDEKAIEAVSSWRFEPASKDGKPVAVAIKLEIPFHLHPIENSKTSELPKKADTSDGGQSATAPPAAAAIAPSPTIDTSDCQALSMGDPHANELSAVCEFARTFRRNLPDFMCEQTTTSGRWPTEVVKEEVKFEKGREVYSNLIINGKPAEANSSVATSGMHFKSSGELGSDLVNLFKQPIVAEFQFRKEAMLHKVPSSVYEFHLAAEENTFFVLRDSHGATLYPEYEGELWLGPNGRLRRLELRSMHLPKGFGLANVEVTIDYSEVPIGDLDTFLLPSRSETNVCDRHNSGLSCGKNVVVFDDCRKFAAKSRILTDNPQP